MGQRLDLHKKLIEILGTNHVYFQPPESVKLIYPCIVYGRSNGRTDHANNSLYLNRKSYALTIIDKDPDSTLPDRIQALPLCSFDRHYKADNLNHYVFTIYY